MLLEEVADCLRFVGGEIVEDDVNLLARRTQGYDLLQEGDELSAGMAGPTQQGQRPQYRATTEEDFRSDFVKSNLAQHPQFEDDVVEESVKEGLRMDPQRPNNFVEYTNLPILDPARITVPTMIIQGEEDFVAREEDLLPFYSQLATHDKRYILLPNGGHLLILEKDHRRFQHEVLSFFDRP